MTGKRPRLMMRRTVSMASLGAGSEAPKPDHVPHQVIGFAPKAFSDNGGSSMPMEDSDAAPVPATAAKSRPFSGLSPLADANATKDAIAMGASICSGEKVGLGILAALDKDASPCSPPGTIIRSMAHPSSPAAAAPPSFKPGCFPDAMSVSICNKGQQQQQQQQARQFDFVFQANSGHRKSDRCSSRTTTLDFLESCYLCKRDISYGRDIYMYRGDRAFCSVECRHQQIVNDERVERRDKCSSAALKQMGGSVNQQVRHVNQRAKVTQATTAAAA